MKGHLRERPKGSGNWYAVIDKRDPANGKRVRKWISLEASGKRQAQIECARIISDMSGVRHLEPNTLTVAQFLDLWLDTVRLQVTPKTLQRYSSIVRANIVPKLGNITLAKLQAIQDQRGLQRCRNSARAANSASHVSRAESGPETGRALAAAA